MKSVLMMHFMITSITYITYENEDIIEINFKTLKMRINMFNVEIKI